MEPCRRCAVDHLQKIGRKRIRCDCLNLVQERVPTNCLYKTTMGDASHTAQTQARTCEGRGGTQAGKVSWDWHNPDGTNCTKANWVVKVPQRWDSADYPFPCVMWHESQCGMGAMDLGWDPITQKVGLAWEPDSNKGWHESQGTCGSHLSYKQFHTMCPKGITQWVTIITKNMPWEANVLSECLRAGDNSSFNKIWNSSTT